MRPPTAGAASLCYSVTGGNGVLRELQPGRAPSSVRGTGQRESLTLHIEYSEYANPQRLCSYVGHRACLGTQEQVPSREGLSFWGDGKVGE